MEKKRVATYDTRDLAEYFDDIEEFQLGHWSKIALLDKDSGKCYSVAGLDFVGGFVLIKFEGNNNDVPFDELERGELL